MKKFTFLVVFACIAIFNLSAQWEALNRTKAAGGEIPEKVNFMAIDNNKLYAATTDGIWESASMNGGDWVAFGLQGQEVMIMNFKDMKLAMANVTSSEDVTQTAGQLYKLVGSNWEVTKFNEDKKTGYMSTTGFAQIRDDNDNLIFVIPTWRQDMWRSEDQGETWTMCPYAVDDWDPSLEIGKVAVGLFTYDGDPVIYGTDKASGSDQYLIWSLDYGKTWECSYVGNVFNPWSFHKRMYNGVEMFYVGGERGQNGMTIMKPTGYLGNWGNWEPACINSIDNSSAAIYWHNRCMLGKDDGPLFVMCSANNVYVSTDDGKTLEPLGTGLSITNPSSTSLTHMVMTDERLYCSSREDGIQVIRISIYNNINETILSKSSVYPNPANDYVMVPADLNSLISINSVQGSLVAMQQASGAETRVDVSGLTSGIYIVQYLKNGNAVTEKIVKQ